MKKAVNKRLSKAPDGTIGAKRLQVVPCVVLQELSIDPQVPAESGRSRRTSRNQEHLLMSVEQCLFSCKTKLVFFRIPLSTKLLSRMPRSRDEFTSAAWSWWKTQRESKPSSLQMTSPPISHPAWMAYFRVPEQARGN